MSLQIKKKLHCGRSYMPCYHQKKKEFKKVKWPGSTIKNASSKTPRPLAHPAVKSANKEAEQMRAIEWSFISPRAHADRNVLIRSLKPWCALNSCRLDGWHLNGLYFTPLPKHDRMCIARTEDDSELWPGQLASSTSAYQKYNRGAFDRRSCQLDSKKVNRHPFQVQ